MKKFLFYINSIHYGGAERVIVNLANEFSKKQYNVIFITSFQEAEEYLLDDNVERIVLENTKLNESFFKRNISRTIKLRKVIKKHRPEIVISFMAEPNFRAIVATRFLNIKTLISIRNDPKNEYPNKFYRLVAWILYPFASGCVFQTNDARQDFSKAVQDKSRIISNPVSSKFYDINYDGKRKNIVSVGRIESQKNHGLLIQAFSKISDDFPNENLIIYGEGSQLENLKKLTLTLGIENRVMFMGTINEIQEKIKDANLFVLSSDYEGLPNALMEAMALGLPVISTDCPCGGPRMLIDNNNNGILVKTNDVEEMTNAISKILKNKVFANKLGKNAKIQANEFKSSKVLEEWENYMLSLKNE